MGVDPSIRKTGYSIIRFEKETRTLECLEASVIKLKTTLDIHTRLHVIYKYLEKEIEYFGVDAVGIESAFVNKKYPKACLSLSQVRGVVLLLVAEKNLKLMNVAPKEAKKIATMSGSAGKDFVQNMCNSIFNTGIKSHDASDAVAIALFTAINLSKN